MNQEKIGKLIAKLRKEKKLTQEQLGAKLGVNGKAVSKWECGLTIPDISIVNELSAILGISTNELLDGKQKDSLNTQKNMENKIKTFLLRNKYFIITIFILSIVCAFFCLFFINNYQKYQLVRFKSNDDKFYAEGYIAIYPNKELIILKDLVYQSEEKGTSKELKIEQLKLNIVNDNKLIFEYIFVKQYDDNGKVKSYYISDILDTFSTVTMENNSSFEYNDLKLLIEYQIEDEIIKEEYVLNAIIEENSSKFIK